MSASDLVSWLRSHPPQALATSGTAQGGGPGFQTTGIGYDDGHSDVWQSAELELGITDGANGHSYLRADAVVVWLDPRPSRDTAGGKRIHFTVGDGCPRSDRGTPGVTNVGPQLDTALLPRAAPTAALICRYDGLNGHAFTVIADRPLNASTATALAARIRRLPLSHPDGAVTNCPSDDGSAAYLAFGYPDGTSVDVDIAPRGCSSIANGHITAAAADVGELVATR